MSVSQIPSYPVVRLAGIPLTVINSGDPRILIGTVPTMIASDSGAFTSSAIVYSLSGYANATFLTGGLQLFTTSVPTGISTLAVFYPQPFASIPSISPTISSTGSIIYGIMAQSISSSGYSAILSDVVMENGIVITTLAKI